MEVDSLKVANQQLQQQPPSQATASTPTASSRSKLPRLALPEKFDGSADRCRGFLRQCDIFFRQQLEAYGSETTRYAFMLLLLTGKVLDWGSAIWDLDPQLKTSANYFANQIKEVFKYPAGGRDISVQLLELCQGSHTAADYAIKFRTLAAQSGWNAPSLMAVFREGLNMDLKVDMACRATDLSLSQYIFTAIRLDNLRHQHQPSATKSRRPLEFHESQSDISEPMQLGRAQVSIEE